MGSLVFLFPAGESLHPLPKRGGRSGVGVGDDSGRYSIQESKRVQLVEESLGRGHGAGLGVRELVQNRFREVVELPRREDTRDKTDVPRFVSAQDAAGAD